MNHPSGASTVFETVTCCSDANPAFCTIVAFVDSVFAASECFSSQALNSGSPTTTNTIATAVDILIFSRVMLKHNASSTTNGNSDQRKLESRLETT